MQQELSDRQIIGRLLWKYAAGYLVLWGILRIAFLISRVTGWGNINGASAVEYVRQMWNTSLLENGHIFCGDDHVCVCAFTVSACCNQGKVRWIRYALVDGAVFALVCLGINGVCRLKFEQKSSGRATCLIDHLLLCGRMRTWQEITCLLAMVVLFLSSVHLYLAMHPDSMRLKYRWNTGICRGRRIAQTPDDQKDCDGWLQYCGCCNCCRDSTSDAKRYRRGLYEGCGISD